MAPWDPGLQPERTELSWRRTVLAVTAGMVLVARYLGDGHPVLGTVLPLAAVAAGLLLLRLTTLRARRTDHALRAAGPSAADPAAGTASGAPPGAALLAVLAAATLLATLVAAGYVLSAVATAG